jgi:hypothetical protein
MLVNMEPAGGMSGAFTETSLNTKYCSRICDPFPNAQIKLQIFFSFSFLNQERVFHTPTVTRKEIA